MNLHEDHEKAALVEEISHMLEQLRGFPRMGGRLFAVLLLTDSPAMSSEELAETLHASRGSISSMTRMLIQMRLVKRVSVRGDRRQYYQLAAPSSMFETGIYVIRQFRSLLGRALEATRAEDGPAPARIDEFHRMYLFFEEEYMNILSRWNEVKERK